MQYIPVCIVEADVAVAAYLIPTHVTVTAQRLDHLLDFGAHLDSFPMPAIKHWRAVGFGVDLVPDGNIIAVLHRRGVPTHCAAIQDVRLICLAHITATARAPSTRLALTGQRGDDARHVIRCR